MATYSTMLNLKLNAPADPFLLSDFVSNFDILDANPGVFICTSASRPSYGAGQAGRIIFMTDLKQLSYWTGSTWADLRDSVPVFGGGTYINQAISAGASPNFQAVNLVTPRPCAMAIVLSATYSVPVQAGVEFYQQITFDGNSQMFGGYREHYQIADLPAVEPTICSITSLAVIPSVASGSHTIGVLVQLTNTFSTALTIVGVKAFGLIGTYSASNSL